MTVYAAGFDRYARISRRQDSLVTGGLGNCIGAAGFDAGSNRAMLCHYNTVQCFGYSQNGKFGVLRPRLVALRSLLEDVGGASAFKVVLGATWAMESEFRTALVTELAEVFGCTVDQAGFVAQFSWVDGVGRLEAGNDESRLPAGWSSAGTPLVYDNADLREGGGCTVS